MQEDALAIFHRALSGSGEHVVFVAPHPDDETVGAGIALSRVMRATVVHVTGGAGSRSREARAALALAGIESVVSMNAAEVAENLAVVAGQLAAVLERLQPDVIVSCAFKDGHPDHDATACAVSMAARVPVAEMASTANGDSILQLELSDYERTLKRSMLECLTTSRELLSQIPIAAERFRNAPPYDFARLGWAISPKEESASS